MRPKKIQWFLLTLGLSTRYDEDVLSNKDKYGRSFVEVEITEKYHCNAARRGIAAPLAEKFMPSW